MLLELIGSRNKNKNFIVVAVTVLGITPKV
jgi:hypothetical protein